MLIAAINSLQVVVKQCRKLFGLLGMGLRCQFGLLSQQNFPLKSTEKAASCLIQSSEKLFVAMLPPELAD